MNKQSLVYLSFFSAILAFFSYAAPLYAEEPTISYYKIGAYMADSPTNVCALAAEPGNGIWCVKPSPLGSGSSCYVNTVCNVSADPAKCRESATCDGPGSTGYGITTQLAQYALFSPNDPQNPNQCAGTAGNPIDTISGNKFQHESLIKIDSPHPIVFDLYFNSKRTEGWRHSYSRSSNNVSWNNIPRYAFNNYVFGTLSFDHESNGGFVAAKSKLIKGINDTANIGATPYMTRQSACEQGWGGYRTRFKYSWISGSTAQFVNGGKCNILDIDNNVRMTLDIMELFSGRVSLFSTYITTSYFRFTRADGSVIIFSRLFDYEPWINQTNTSERIEILNSGYRLYTAEDTLEEYDLNGRLLTITAADGHVQTLTYDVVTGLLSRVENQTGEYIDLAYVNFGTSNQYQRLDSVTDHTGRSWHFRYDVNDNLQYVDNPDGSTRQYHYENTAKKNLLTGITDERGVRYATWTYEYKGRAISSAHGTNADIDRVDLVYSTTNDGTRTITTKRKSAVTGVTTNIVSTYKTHATSGKPLVAQVSGPGCSSCGVGQTTYEHDARTGNLEYKIEYGVRTEYGNYDNRGNPGYIIEAVGTPEQRRTDYTYDARFHSKVATITEPSVFPGANKVTTNSYDDYGNLVSTVVSGYKPDGIQISRTSTYQYNGPYHQLSLVDGPRTDVSDVFNFNYYSVSAGSNSARLQSIIGPDGIALRDNMQYTATGKIQSETRGNLQISYDYYPGNDRLQRMSLLDAGSASSRITEWTYLPTGEVASIKTGAGTTDATMITLGYDSARRLTRVTDGLGNYIEYVLDSEGNTEQENVYDASNVLKKTLTQTFDVYNRLDNFSEANQLNNRDFNANGTLAKATDGKGVVTSYGYDSLKRLTSVTQNVGGTDVTTANALTSYGYDSQNNLISVTDANNGATTFVYDDLGNVLSQSSPDTGTAVYTHDEAGNVLTKTDAKNQLFNYTYDFYNRLTGIDAPGTVDDVSLTYDSCNNGHGRVCSITRNTSTETWAYNAMGDVTSHQHNVVTFAGYATAINNLTYSYDHAGRLQTMTYPSGAVMTYGYDAAGQVSSVGLDANGTHTSLLNVTARHPFGMIAEASYGNGQAMNDFVYGDYRPQTLVEALQYTALQYDLNGNPTNLGYPQGSSTFTYDAHQRLDSVSGSLGAYNFNYDKVGNKTTDGAGQTMGYQTNSNRMNMLDGVAVTIDANGNTETLRGMGLNYSSDNLLTSASTGVAFDYNGLNQRSIKKTTASGVAGQYGYGSSVVYLYGQNSELLAEIGPTGSVTKEYIYLEGKPLAMLDHAASSNETFLNGDLDKDGVISMEDALIWNFNYSGNNAWDVTGDGVNNQTDIDMMFGCGFTQNSCKAASFSTSLYYIHNDHLGTPKLMTNNLGAIVWNATATPFGKATVNSDYDGDGKTITLNIRQPGQYYDRETGLYYNLNRYFDPNTGRYVTSDPIGLEGGVNTYAYVGNSPLKYIDPEGKFFFVPFVAAAIFEGGGVATAGYITGGALVIGGAIVMHNSSGNSISGTPNSWSPDGKRHYGPDGFPDFDLDPPHHDKPDPHVHDWDRPEDGSAPTHKNRKKDTRPYSPVPQQCDK